MKRNNIFMLSYIIFVFICLVVKMFCDYNMWVPLIAAITVSSCLFAISDICHTISDAYLDDVNAYTPLLDVSLRKVCSLESLFDENREDIEFLKGKGVELAEALFEGIALMGRTKTRIESIRESITEKSKTQKIVVRMVDPLIFGGFLSFFCTIVFEKVSGLLIPYQDYLTVLAFGIILATQYIATHLRDEHEELEQHYNEVNKVLSEIEKNVDSRCKQIRELAARSIRE